MELQVDIESKPEKVRHHSGGSSVDEGRRGGSAKWAREPSSSSSSSLGKKSKGKLRKRGGRMKEWREDVDAQLLEQRSGGGGGHSSEPDSPSLSDSVPSVAESHCSRLSELSGSEPEGARTPGADRHARFSSPANAVSPLPEVEHDRLENGPDASAASPLRLAAEETVSLIRPARPASPPPSPARNAGVQTDI